MSARVVPNVVREHAELAAFLWAQRDTLAEEDPPDGAVLTRIDRRLEANLDGLRIASEAAWPFALELVEENPQKGEIFLAGWMALGASEHQWIEEVVALARGVEDTRGLPGALARLPPSRTGPFVRLWLDSADPFRQWLGAAALIAHRADPLDRLPPMLASPDPRLRAAASRLAGLIGRRDAVAALSAMLADPAEPVRFWAAWSLAELGEGAAAQDQLRRAALAGGPEALAALRAVVRIGPVEAVRAWFRDLLASPGTAAVAVRGAGMLEDPSLLLWLVRQMRVPALAPASAAAFLELFPESRALDELWSQDPQVLGLAFLDHFGDDIPILPVAERVKAWGQRTGTIA